MGLRYEYRPPHHARPTAPKSADLVNSIQNGGHAPVPSCLTNRRVRIRTPGLSAETRQLWHNGYIGDKTTEMSLTRPLRDSPAPATQMQSGGLRSVVMVVLANAQVISMRNTLVLRRSGLWLAATAERG